MVITIDGPSISGKTSIARMLAHHLHFDYLASGLLFRGLAYILVHHYDYHESQLPQPRLLDVEDALRPSHFEYRYSSQAGEQIFWNSQEITPFLPDQKIGKYASLIATNQDVRNALVQLQHKYADDKDLVTDGRDAGSIVFPYAQIKFFLTASIAARAERWQANQKEIGRDISFEQAEQEISERDERDSNRAFAPLVIPEHAIIIDNSSLSIKQVLERMLQEIQKEGGI